MNWLLIAVGGAFGALGRAGVVGVCARIMPGWPLGTLLVNTLGCVAIGILAGAGVARGSPAWAALATGVLGGFTTFSAYGLELHDHMAQGHGIQAVLYVVASLLAATLGVAAGHQMGRLWPV